RACAEVGRLPELPAVHSEAVGLEGEGQGDRRVQSPAVDLAVVEGDLEIVGVFARAPEFPDGAGQVHVEDGPEGAGRAPGLGGGYCVDVSGDEPGHGGPEAAERRVEADGGVGALGIEA